MKAFNLKGFAVILSLVFTTLVQAQVLLPLHTLRNQGTTDHCWAYSMTHLLETRALVRDSNEIMINIEKDIKYWVDYERMMYNFRTKQSFYLGNYEGGWQIEYFESLLKHGKSIYSNAKVTPQLRYQPLQDYFSNMKFLPEPRQQEDSTLPSWEQASQAMRTQFKTEQEAHNYAINYLNRKYGQPQATTQWNGRPIAVSDTAKAILGSDYVVNQSVDALVLVKPTSDGNFGWIKYLENRYWGYRYDKAQILPLIELSLNNKFPVTFDNVYHAMTIVAYTPATNGVKYYAVADSIPGKITWYSADKLLGELNLVTFFRYAIPNALPPKSSGHMLRLMIPYSKTLDQFDNVAIPPR